MISSQNIPHTFRLGVADTETGSGCGQAAKAIACFEDLLVVTETILTHLKDEVPLLMRNKVSRDHFLCSSSVNRFINTTPTLAGPLQRGGDPNQNAVIL